MSGPERSPRPDHRVRIGVDVAETEGRVTGVGRFTIEILSRWLASEECRGGAEVICFARRSEAVPAELSEGAQVVASERDGGVVRWQQLGLPRLLGKCPVDVLFAPAYAIPLSTGFLSTGTPTVVALHDLSFERDPGSFSPRERWRRRLLARWSARRAQRVLTISRFSVEEIAQLYGVDRERIDWVYPGVDLHRFYPDQTVAEPARPNLLSVGTILNRRNLDVLVHAFARLPSRFDDHELVIVGANRTRPRLDLRSLAAERGVGERVRFVDHVDEDELVKLYRGTDLLISLSSYEGFGLPVLEGLACGAPVLVLDRGVYRELWRDHAHLVAEPEAASVASAIATAAGDARDVSATRRHLARTFDWEEAAARVFATLRSVADASPRPYSS